MYYVVIQNKVKLEHVSFLTLIEMIEILIDNKEVDTSKRIEIWDDTNIICRHAYDHENDGWHWKEPLRLVK